MLYVVVLRHTVYLCSIWGRSLWTLTWAIDEYCYEAFSHTFVSDMGTVYEKSPAHRTRPIVPQGEPSHDGHTIGTNRPRTTMGDNIGLMGTRTIIPTALSVFARSQASRARRAAGGRKLAAVRVCAAWLMALEPKWPQRTHIDASSPHPSFNQKGEALGTNKTGGPIGPRGSM